jgi:hypothetical protein
MDTFLKIVYINRKTTKRTVGAALRQPPFPAVPK